MPGFEISFHGAAQVVTGSKHLLRYGDTRLLMDAGMFQGRRKLRDRNWAEPAFDPASIDHVMITHSHIDHIGFLPRLVKLGLKAPVHLTPAAFQLAELMLLDSAKIQEEDARYANKKGYAKHKPALPLYDSEDARRALELRRKARFRRWIPLAHDGLRARFTNNGHLLGSAFIEAQADLGDRVARVVYCGDLGRFEVPLHLDPKPMPECDVLIVESTYGNRSHTEESPTDQLAEALGPVLREGGTVLIPAFAVGRSQQITLMLRRLIKAERLPDVPIHLDSPMAINATRIYSRFLDKRNLDPEVFEDGRLRLFPRDVHFHRSAEESISLNDMPGPRILVASSGMLSGGRVLHHLKRLAPGHQNLIVLVGYQGVGTRGRRILDGEETVRVHGQDVPLNAKTTVINGLSGHADADDLMSWIGSAKSPPRFAFVVHGEPDASGALAERLESAGMSAFLPELDERFDLAALLG